MRVLRMLVEFFGALDCLRGYCIFSCYVLKANNTLHEVGYEICVCVINAFV
ncbi:hypothetical protein D9M68_838890 [compost metagenome]